MRARYSILGGSVLLCMVIAAPCAERAFIPPVTSAFGVRHDPMNGSRAVHRGIDFAAAFGAPVHAAASGTVRFAGSRGGYGLLVEIAHGDGSSAFYAHLSAIDVQVGDRVDVAAVIGRVGSTGRSTGPHLHFEYRIGGRAVDPMPYFSGIARSAAIGVQGDVGGDKRRPVAAAPAVHRSQYALDLCRAAASRRDEGLAPAADPPTGCTGD